MATYTKCNRCSGTGNLPEYNHVMGGVCLKCNGKGKFVKTKRVTIVETYYVAVTFNGVRVDCGTDKEKAEALHAEWKIANCEGEIISYEGKKYIQVPV